MEKQPEFEQAVAWDLFMTAPFILKDPKAFSKLRAPSAGMQPSLGWNVPAVLSPCSQVTSRFQRGCEQHCDCLTLQRGAEREGPRCPCMTPVGTPQPLQKEPGNLSRLAEVMKERKEEPPCLADSQTDSHGRMHHASKLTLQQFLSRMRATRTLRNQPVSLGLLSLEGRC